MKEDEQLRNVCEDIYRELYQKAQPSADFDQLKKTKLNKEKNSDPEAYLDHYLPQQQQTEIIEKHCKKHNLKDWQKDKVRTTIHIGAAPAGSKKAWRKDTEQ